MLPAHHVKSFCNRLVSVVKIATAYQADVDHWSEGCQSCEAPSVVANDRHSKAMPEELSKKWSIGIDTAKDASQCATQFGIRVAAPPMTRRLRVDHLRLHHPRLCGAWHANALISKHGSKLGNKCASIFAQGKLAQAALMTAQSNAGKPLIKLAGNVGAPEPLVTDGASELAGPRADFIKGRKNQSHAAEHEVGTKVKAPCWHTAHKFGARLPCSIKEALQLNEEPGVDLWGRAINKEMSKVKVTWRAHKGHTPDEVQEGKASDLIGCQEVGCHLVFDVKMGFSCKARLVAGGRAAEAPASTARSSAAPLDSVHATCFPYCSFE